MDYLSQKDFAKNMKTFTQNKPAFTMFELVMAIVVLGILASVSLPRLNRDHKQDAADSILADIRHTQSLALNDFKHDFADPRWQRAFWTIGFRFCEGSVNYYQFIGSDVDYGGEIGANESVRDAINGKETQWSGLDNCDKGNETNPNVSNRIFLTYNHGVTAIRWQGSCAGAQYIGFDHLGRPHQGYTNSDEPNYNSYLSEDCNINFTMSDGQNFTIVITPETGYTYILSQEDS